MVSESSPNAESLKQRTQKRAQSDNSTCSSIHDRWRFACTNICTWSDPSGNLCRQIRHPVLSTFQTLKTSCNGKSYPCPSSHLQLSTFPYKMAQCTCQSDNVCIQMITSHRGNLLHTRVSCQLELWMVQSMVIAIAQRPLEELSSIIWGAVT